MRKVGLLTAATCNELICSEIQCNGRTTGCITNESFESVAMLRSLGVKLATPLSSKLLQTINITFWKTCQLLQAFCTDISLMKDIWGISGTFQVLKSRSNSFLRELLGMTKGFEKGKKMWLSYRGYKG
jgi:hypothetical protein